MAKRSGRTIEDQRQTIANANPQHRLVQPSEIAELVSFISSDLAPALTMEDIQINAGAFWWSQFVLLRTLPDLKTNFCPHWTHCVIRLASPTCFCSACLSACRLSIIASSSLRTEVWAGSSKRFISSCGSLVTGKWNLPKIDTGDFHRTLTSRQLRDHPINFHRATRYERGTAILKKVPKWFGTVYIEFR